MNKKIVATKSFPLAADWFMWLKDFGDLVADKQYHKLDYHLWKNISKPTIKGIVTNITFIIFTNFNLPVCFLLFFICS